VLPEPRSWEPATTGAAPAFGVLGARPVADLDPGRTNVKGSGAAATAGPAPAQPGAAPWLTPGAAVDTDLAAGETQLRAPRSRPADPALSAPAPAPGTSPAGDARRRWAIGAGVGVAAAAVVAVLVAVSGGSGQPAAAGQQPGGAAAEPVTVLGPSEDLPSGLRTVREAAFDEESGLLTTTVTWSADAALAGPLFEAVPPAADGTPCPAVTWSVPAVRDATPGIAGTACGWQLPVDVPAGGEVTATHTVPFRAPEGEDVAQAVRDRLSEQGRATGTALEGLVATPVYPAQRLDDLEVQIGGTVRVGAPVDVVVLPVWRGTDAADNVSVVASSRSPQPTLLLRQLGGDLEVGTDDCTGSLAFTDQVPYANTVGSNCTVSVRLGDVEARSRTFDVLQNSLD
jgi:serine/threonine-protein kinase